MSRTKNLSMRLLKCLAAIFLFIFNTGIFFHIAGVAKRWLFATSKMQHFKLSAYEKKKTIILYRYTVSQMLGARCRTYRRERERERERHSGKLIFVVKNFFMKLIFVIYGFGFAAAIRATCLRWSWLCWPFRLPHIFSMK